MKIVINKKKKVKLWTHTEDLIFDAHILKKYIYLKVLFDCLYICFYYILVCFEFHFKVTITFSFWLISTDSTDSGNNIKDL